MCKVARGEVVRNVSAGEPVGDTPDGWQKKIHREFICAPFPLGLFPVASADRGICSHRKLPTWSL